MMPPTPEKPAKKHFKIEDDIESIRVKPFTRVFYGLSAISVIRTSMTKSEWFADMTDSQKKTVAEIGLAFVLFDNKGDCSTAWFDNLCDIDDFDVLISELRGMLDIENPYCSYAMDFLLKVANITNDGNEWLEEYALPN
jgi:hypothetical protein